MSAETARFKTEQQLLDSGWRWTGGPDPELITDNISRDNAIPKNMLEELSGVDVIMGTGYWTITPAMVLSESEEVELILKSYNE
jgi:hypothetical protein